MSNRNLHKIKFIKKLFNRSFVVIEIGNDWLKILELDLSTTPLSITNAYFMKLSAIKGDISDAVSNIFKELNLNKNAVITYLPRHLATVRVLELPSTVPQEIDDILSLQISKQTPYSKDEIIFSYAIIGSEKENYSKVMTVIIRRNLIDERLDILQKAGIHVERITLSSEGVYNCFNDVYLQGLDVKDLDTITLVDIDSNYSDFIISRKGKLVYTKNILIGTNQLIEDQQTCKEKFADELKHAISLYQAESKNTKIEKLFLSGAVSNIKNLCEVLTATLNISCEAIGSLRNIGIRDESIIFKNDNFKFISISALIGIAFKHNDLKFDLLPSELRLKHFMEKKRKNLTKTGILFAAIIMIVLLSVLIHTYNRNMYLSQLKGKIAEIEKDAGEVENMRRVIYLIQRRLDARGEPLNILYELYKTIPKEIYLTDINIERKKQIALKGRAYAMSDVFKYISNMEGSPYFKNVKNTYTTTKKEEGSEFVDFEIVCVYEE